MNKETKQLTIKAFRFNKETDYLPYYDTFTMDVNQDELVLDVMNRIKWEHDGSFSYRRSCRHGICGSCAVKVNGKAKVIENKELTNSYLDLFDSFNFSRLIEVEIDYIIANCSSNLSVVRNSILELH